MESKKVYKIKISSWTASFRYPNLISGYQPTLQVPPLSTVLGLINAAAGRYLDYTNISLGYYFCYQSSGIDLETIYQIGYQLHKNIKSNVMKREFLFENELFLYLEDEDIAGYFKKPKYPILLGRSGDLATVEEISEDVSLKKIKDAEKIKGQIIPFNSPYQLPGVIQALPQYFTDEVPRKNLYTQPYAIINWETKDVKTDIECFRDESLASQGIDIFFHQLNETR